MGVLVERLRDIAKALLPGSVPNVKAYLSVVDLGPFDLEIDPDCAEQVGVEDVLAVSHEEAGLANSAVANYEVLQCRCSSFHLKIIYASGTP